MPSKKENRRAYLVWKGMLHRCENEDSQNYSSYGGRGVRVCQEWHDFEKFNEWYQENYYPVEGEYTALDKDVLGDGLLYSPETCLMLPRRLNSMLINSMDRGIKKFYNNNGMFQVRVSNPMTGKNEYKGCYKDVEVAKRVYTECKTAIFRGVVEEYKEVLPVEVYQKLTDFKL